MLQAGVPEQSERSFEALLAYLSARFINVPADRLDAEIRDAQQRVCECLGLDLSTVWQQDDAQPDLFVLTHLYRPLGGPDVPQHMLAQEYFPWCLQKVLAGEVVAVDSTRHVPTDAERDRESWLHYEVKTSLTCPLAAGGGTPFGIVSFNDMRSERTWSETLIHRVALVADVFANAIARREMEMSLRVSEARLALAADSADAGLWSFNLESRCFWMTDKTRELFGFDAAETVTLERFMSLVHPSDRPAVQQTIDAIIAGEDGRIEYRISGEDGTVRWMASRARMCCEVPGEADGLMMGVTVEVTGRKVKEEKLKAAFEEIRHLRDRLKSENVYLREQLRRSDGQDEIVGESKPMLYMIAKAQQVAPTDATVLITGETGTGKELLAQAIHNMSSRSRKPMIKVNCAALPAPLIEGELFGREKGAYTGALTRQAGRFEVADGSTIFLDEIGDLPLELQSRLLRVLEDRQFERLGSSHTLSVNVRVIAATNRDLAEMVRQGTFREDLYHRLHIFPIEVPPLRDRPDDIPRMVWKFVQEFNMKMGRSIDSIPRPVMQRLKTHSWPGNARELRNAVERAMIVCVGRSLSIELPSHASHNLTPPLGTLEEVERNHIRAVLEQTHWRISGKGGAAERLGLVPTTLHSRMKKLGIARPD